MDTLQKITKLTNKITATYHSNEPKYNNEHINWVKINLTKDSQYKKLMKDKEIVFICAAYTKGASVIVNSPMDLVTPNIIMNSNILENCYKFGVKKVEELAKIRERKHPHTSHTKNIIFS